MGAPTHQTHTPGGTGGPYGPSGDVTNNSTGSLESTYTALIQEYLQIMCLENATFLAERLVASCKTTNAFYLLAVCHYRNRSPQRALMVLEEVKVGNAATDYLTAKCCFDLEQYGRAEEALLQKARGEYREYKASTTNSSTMDSWLVESSPCPVPNGAAGFFLLGNICRRSNRKPRAMQYYKMSLQVRRCQYPKRRSFEKIALLLRRGVSQLSFNYDSSTP